MNDRFLQRVLRRIKRFKEDYDDSFTAYDRQALRGSAWNWVMKEASKEAKKK